MPLVQGQIPPASHVQQDAVKFCNFINADLSGSQYFVAADLNTFKHSKNGKTSTQYVSLKLVFLARLQRSKKGRLAFQVKN